MLFIAAAFIVIGMQLMPYITIKEIGPYSLTEQLFIFLIGFLIASYGLYLRIRAKRFPQNIFLTLYRLQGLIELPRNDESLESFVIRFDDLKAIKRSITTTNYHSGPMIMFIRDASTRLIPKAMNWIGMSWSNNPMEYWSFYVWYMDKNRPLPPGSAFDPYRKKDYERRKAEGFPPPFYKSLIPTPEYVPGSEGSIVDNLN